MLSMEMVLTPVNLLCSRLRRKGAKVTWEEGRFFVGQG